MQIARAAAIALAAASLLPAPACAGRKVTHFAPVGPKPAGLPADAKPPFSSSVLVGDTLYLSGVLDLDPVTRRPGTTTRDSARLVLDALKQSVEAAGLSIDDLVWLQVFATDLGTFSEFGAVYAGYFHGALPARTFVGVAALMGGAHFEVNAIAVRKPKR
jgi:2-iminobutanoate/2-iminopropanoate deaminase